ncbi:dihydrodipicolinate synthase family protein [Niabella insulamsoli]|uniref:dihydrodipicolinate synthase family protein n=1 Tax=Niabella insulamsoli TaxID=3144874 RepID=UPI0031FD4A82
MIEKLNGLIAAPFTPMNEDGSLNLSRIPAYYAILKSNGNTGAFICGSTGEGVALTLAEKQEVITAWADCTRNDDSFKVMVLVGGTCISDCIALAKFAQHSGLYAVSFTAPFYFKPSAVADLAACCKVIANEVPDMPFYYYHIPVLNGVGFAMLDLLKAVGDIPNFAGVKYTHEDFMDFLSCVHFKSGRYDMLWGRDENMLAALSVGAKGAVGSTFNYAAPLYHAMIDAFHRNDLTTAQALQQQSIDMITLLGKYGGIATGKAYMKLIGLDCGKFRLPVRNMSDASFELFKKDVKELNFETFCSRPPAQFNAS